MSETIYTKSLTSDFGSSLDQRQFHKEIVDETGITKTLLRVDKVDDDIYIVFDNTLDVGEQTLLDTLVSNHTPTIKLGSQMENINIHKSTIKSTSYDEIISFTFPGTIRRNLTHIKFLGYMKKKNGATYDVRVYDSTNNQVIAEATFNNDDKKSSLQDLGTLSNLPTEEAMFDVQAKVSSGGRFYPKNINIYYD